MPRPLLALAAALLAACSAPPTTLPAPVNLPADGPWLVFPGGDGPGAGRQIVFVTGDEEYRSEEGMPQLAAILAERHGFTTTVLFAIDPQTGLVNPDHRGNIPGLEALAQADLVVLFTRFRSLGDEQAAHLDAYLKTGKPLVALRTATHAFAMAEGSAYGHWTWNGNQEGWAGGFGRRVLGETWINHHGHHGHEATRGLLVDGRRDHPILAGLEDGAIFGPTDVYGVRLPLPEGCTPLVLGQVVAGMDPADPPVEGPKNDPMMPVAWTREHGPDSGLPRRVFTTTMGASQDLLSPGLRRLLVNACYWALELEDVQPVPADVDLVGTYEPSPYAFGGFREGLRPADFSPHAGAR